MAAASQVSRRSINLPGACLLLECVPHRRGPSRPPHRFGQSASLFIAAAATATDTDAARDPLPRAPREIVYNTAAGRAQGDNKYGCVCVYPWRGNDPVRGRCYLLLLLLAPRLFSPYTGFLQIEGLRFFTRRHREKPNVKIEGKNKRKITVLQPRRAALPCFLRRQPVRNNR